MPEYSWSFTDANGKDRETLTFIITSMTSLVLRTHHGRGMANSAILQPQLIRDERLVEVMPKWRFEALIFSVSISGTGISPIPFSRSSW